MRIHVLGIPHTQTSERFTSCAFTQKALNLCKMMHRRGHEVFHYGVEGSNPECTEHVSLIPESTFETLYGHPGDKPFNIEQGGDLAPYHALFGLKMREALLDRTGEPDTEIICQTWGGAQRVACEGVNQYLVESGIGYPESWADWRVYESYAWMHMHLGRDRLFGGARWYWSVIPNAFDLKNFSPLEEGQARGDDFLYLGRLNQDKGVALAIQAAKEAGRKITIVGQGDPEPFLRGNPHASYLPPVGVADRRELLRHAHAVFCPTIYVEPFGGVHVEAMLSGTPVITSDHGVFNETVLHGVTGYRCRSFEHFAWAAKNVHRLDGRACAAWARANFSLERVALMYEEFFQQILNVRDSRGRRVSGPTGFYEPHPGRTQLDWLCKVYPPAAAELALDLTRPHEAPAPAAAAGELPAGPPTSLLEWNEAQAFESAWWGLEHSARWDEEIKKQETYHRLMGIGERRDFGQAEILDVGCGPVSLLQRTKHGPSRGVDPLPMSAATLERYRAMDIELVACPAEEMPTDRTFDEVWMYNCLQHTRDPREILRRIARCAHRAGQNGHARPTSVRIFEWIETGTAPGHPQDLTEALFAGFFAVGWDRPIWNVGTVSDVGGSAHGKYVAIHATRR